MNRVFPVLCVCLSFALALASPVRASELGKEMAEADARLNAVYQEVLKGMPEEAARGKLKDAQRAWIAWRDAEIAISESLYEDGKTGLFMNLALTKLRIEQLETIAKRESEYGYAYTE